MKKTAVIIIILALALALLPTAAFAAAEGKLLVSVSFTDDSAIKDAEIEAIAIRRTHEGGIAATCILNAANNYRSELLVPTDVEYAVYYKCLTPGYEISLRPGVIEEYWRGRVGSEPIAVDKELYIAASLPQSKLILSASITDDSDIKDAEILVNVRPRHVDTIVASCVLNLSNGYKAELTVPSGTSCTLSYSCLTPGYEIANQQDPWNGSAGQEPVSINQPIKIVKTSPTEGILNLSVGITPGAGLDIEFPEIEAVICRRHESTPVAGCVLNSGNGYSTQIKLPIGGSYSISYKCLTPGYEITNQPDPWNSGVGANPVNINQRLTVAKTASSEGVLNLSVSINPGAGLDIKTPEIEATICRRFESTPVASCVLNSGNGYSTQIKLPLGASYTISYRCLTPGYEITNQPQPWASPMQETVNIAQELVIAPTAAAEGKLNIFASFSEDSESKDAEIVAIIRRRGESTVLESCVLNSANHYKAELTLPADVSCSISYTCITPGYVIANESDPWLGSVGNEPVELRPRFRLVKGTDIRINLAENNAELLSSEDAGDITAILTEAETGNEYTLLLNKDNGHSANTTVPPGSYTLSFKGGDGSVYHTKDQKPIECEAGKELQLFPNIVYGSADTLSRTPAETRPAMSRTNVIYAAVSALFCAIAVFLFIKLRSLQKEK